MESNITVIGSGYVGMSLSVLLAQKHYVTVFDIDNDRVQKISQKQSTVTDEDIQNFLDNRPLNLKPTNDFYEAINDSEFIIIATPTDYDDKTNKFDTSSVDLVIKKIIESHSNSTIIIKSTIPVGYTMDQCRKHNSNNIIFSPEFLREGKALHDNLYPSRIIIGQKSKEAEKFANILRDCSENKNAQIKYTQSNEAEAIKLFANTYLAMRVSFFNELDTYSFKHNLNSKDIIDGLSMDSRINDGYNNPSFGYGGYCLPKDTKQLLANFSETPQDLIRAIVKSNQTRKEFIASEVLKRKPNKVGIYRLTMKEGSDNFRFSAIIDIIDIIKSKDVDILVYEPLMEQNNKFGYEIQNNLKVFKSDSDIILANRLSEDLADVSGKVLSRDVYGDN
jgi:UDPglucose 6-dehydrogenase